MSVKYAICVFVTLAVVGPVHLDDSVAQNEIADTSYSERDPLNMGERNVNNQNLDYFGNNNQLIGNNNVGGSWLASARDALSGPAGQIVVHMAKEMISRSTGNSQVNMNCGFFCFVFVSSAKATLSLVYNVEY